jgi:hypothetical protein
MKMKFVTLTAAVMLIASAALAQTTTTVVHVWDDPNAWWNTHWSAGIGDHYSANELSMDFFGSYLNNEDRITDMFHTNIRHGWWGGGVGANYFFLREIGIGADMNMPVNGGKLIDSVTGQLIARLPIACSGLAPYIFGGGGGQSDPVWQWTYDAGAGLEYRWNPVTGIFADWRYNWAAKTSDTILFRAGLRIVF